MPAVGEHIPHSLANKSFWSTRLTLALATSPTTHPAVRNSRRGHIINSDSSTCRIRKIYPLTLPSLPLFFLSLPALSLAAPSPVKRRGKKNEKKRSKFEKRVFEMGKLICDSTTSSPVIAWKDPTSTPSLDLVDQTSTASALAGSSWENVSGLEDQQRRHLLKLHAKGVLWKHPADQNSSVVFRLSHGGEVDADGNCLFTASRKAMGMTTAASATDLRRRTVRRFLEDLGSASNEEREVIQSAIKHMYSPDLKSGWGIHVVQEVKLFAKKADRESLDAGINELVELGMQRELAAESIYKERCTPVDDGPSWAKYMSISGSPDDEYDIITLQYTEEGLLSVDENRDGRAAAFGDDIAIECLATEFKREIFVVQAHGSDAMVDEDSCVFFLPHRPRSEICELPFFLFMKGTGWCGAGADHYEPLIAHPSSVVSQEKVALVL